MGVEVDEDANEKNGKGDEVVERISKEKESGGGRLNVWVVKTDEEEQCARMAVSFVSLKGREIPPQLTPICLIWWL